MRLDVGIWGIMGVGLGYCIVVFMVCFDRLVVVVEGDFGFGFSVMEVEVCLIVCLFVFLYKKFGFLGYLLF